MLISKFISIFYLLLVFTAIPSFADVSVERNFNELYPVKGIDGESLNLESLNKLHDNFYSVVELNMTWRAKAKELYSALNYKIENNIVLESSDLKQIHALIDAYKIVLKKNDLYVSLTKWVTEDDVELSLPHSQTKYENSVRLTFPFYYKKISINPGDPAGSLFARTLKISFVTAFILFDNHMTILQKFYDNKELRIIIQNDNPRVRQFLDDVYSGYNDLGNSDKIYKAVKYYGDLSRWETLNSRSFFVSAEQNKYLNSVLNSLYSYREIKARGLFDILADKFNHASGMTADFFTTLLRGASYNISKFFGNTAGLFESRKGYLSEMSAHSLNELESRLRPLDILLEKTPFRLTDQFIPGHWGHVAIWIGTEEDLRAAGIWDMLDDIYHVAKQVHGYDGPSFQTLVQQGHYIIEALRVGVKLSTLSDFLNIDDFAAIRPTGLNDESIKEYLINAFIQIGKDYDFNFDVESNDTIVCSELAYVVFDSGYNWPTGIQLGRYTITPDNIAVKATGQDSRFEPIVLFHDGKELPNKYIKENFNYLLNLEYSKIIHD